MGRNYDPAWVRAHYDEYGIREWERWDASPVQAVKFEVHRHYLGRFVSPTDRVLEIGAGAGRFTRELARITKRIVVADISPVQVELNRRHSVRYGFRDSVESYVETDVLTLSERFDAEAFDVVVCYGGVLSYTLDRRSEAVRQLSHVTRNGGLVLVSVMCLFGSIHQFLPRILSLDPGLNERVLRTGDVTEEERSLSRHRHHLFRSGELRELLETGGLSVIKIAASNSVSAAWDDELKEVRSDHVRWNHLLSMEIEATAEPGCADMGTHIIAVAEKTRA